MHVNYPNPFIVFCQKTIPLAFDESMSYMEALYAFKAFLENEVIPAINTNADAVERIEKWIEDLDLQDEVDKKLDEMAESGELTDLIAGYLNLRGILAYDSVASMKTADNLADGSFAETYGFYAKGDMGGAKYKIRTVTNIDTIDEITLIALADETLVAELMLEDTMNVRQFGAKGDGETDDTAKIQKALDFCKNIIIPDGTYMINAVTSLLPNSNNYIEINENAILKAITNGENHYAVIKIDNKSNVIIKGGTIEGERSTHTGETGEWGHCVSIINGSTNIALSNITLKNAWGDGLYIYDGIDVRTTGLIIDNVRRNGISIISAVNYKSTNDTIRNTNGTAPQAGVDIEPNNTNNVFKNVCFENLHTENNAGRGLSVYIARELTSPVKISVVNHYDYGSLSGLLVAKSPTLKGLIDISNPSYYNSVENGIFLRGCYDGDCLLKIVRPYIYNCNTSLSTSVAYGTGISIYNSSDDTDLAIGNIEIYEPYVVNSRAETTNFLYIYQGGTGTTNDSAKNIKIINPLFTQNDYINVGTTTIDNFVFKDEYNAVDYSFTGSTNVLANQFYGHMIFTGSQNRTLTVNANNKVGKVLKVTNLSAHTLTLSMVDQTCSMLGVTTGGSIKLTHYGDSITLKKMSSTEWIVVNQVGTITVA